MRYRIHRIKDAPRENFRWAAHTGGVATVKLRDYDAAEEIESASPYAAWTEMLEAGMALRPGDLLETLDGQRQPAVLHIAKYIGFEPAQWFIPEQKADVSSENAQEFRSQSASIPPLQ